MHILVTGGAGYIGSIAINKLIKDHKVTVFDNFSTGNKLLLHKKANFYQGDLRTLSEVTTVFEQEKIDAVMHFAAFSQVGESVKNPQKYFENNVGGSKNLLDAMMVFGVKKIIFSSTAAIFGEATEIPIAEEASKEPTNPYGESKLEIEKLLEKYDKEHDLKYVALRYFNAAGAAEDGSCGEMHDPETHLIPLILKTAKGERESIRIFGTDYPTPDGTCVRDYIHVEDLAEAHMLALDFLQREGNSENFNLGSQQGYSVREVIEECKKVTQKDFLVEEAERRAGDPAILIASSQKIREKIGWQAKRSLTEMVRDAWEWEREKYVNYNKF